MKAVRICLSARRPCLLGQCKTARFQHLRLASQSANADDVDAASASAFKKSIEDAVNRIRQEQNGAKVRRIVARPSPPPLRYSFNPLAEARPTASSSLQEHVSNLARDTPRQPFTQHEYQEKFIVRPTLERFPDAGQAHRTSLISSEKDFATVKEALPLLVGDGPWQLSKTKPHRLYRNFRFKTFKTTWEFMNIVAAECAIQKHHPEWANIYNRVRINWVTHDPPGLSSKDIYMAKFCDEKAKELGESPHDAEPYTITRLGSLTDNELNERARVMDHLKSVLRSRQIDVNFMRSLVEKLVKLG